VSIYVKLVCEALTDAKLLAAGPGGFWLWARGLLYAKQHLTDGVIPDAAMPLVAFGVADPQTEATKLVTLKLWEPCEGGHRVPAKTWAKYQTTAADVEAMREKRSRAGRKGAESKWNKHGTLPENDGTLPSENGSLPKARNDQSTEYRAQSTEHRVQSTNTDSADAEQLHDDFQTSDDAGSRDGDEKPRNAYTESFERWYSHYPKKVAKQAAAAAFGRSLTKIATTRGINRSEACDWLCDVTAIFSRSPKGTGQFVPYPATWLNEGRYEDDPEEWNRDGKRSNQSGRVGEGQRFRG
jgi:hypothetical protein